MARTYSWKEAEGRYAHDLPMFIENWDAAGTMYSNAHDLLRFSDDKTRSVQSYSEAP